MLGITWFWIVSCVSGHVSNAKITTRIIGHNLIQKARASSTVSTVGLTEFKYYWAEVCNLVKYFSTLIKFLLRCKQWTRAWLRKLKRTTENQQRVVTNLTFSQHKQGEESLSAWQACFQAFWSIIIIHL